MRNSSRTPDVVKMLCVSAFLFATTGCGSSPENQLAGTWKGTDEFGQTMQFTFDPDGQLRVDVDGAGGSFSKFGSYKIDLSKEPAHFDFKLPDRDEIKTILRLIDEQQIALENINSSDERPVEFGDRRIVLKRQ